MSDQTTAITKPVLALIGQTAVGKTALSIQIATCFDCEIVSVDSMQVYRHMNIGTAKVSKAEQAGIRHHLIDIVEPDKTYHVACFIDDALTAIAEIHARNKIPLLTGGTGLYLKALRQGLFENASGKQSVRDALQQQITKHGLPSLYNALVLADPEYAGKIHQHDTTRIIRALEVIQTTGKTVTAHRKEQSQRKTKCFFKKFLNLGLAISRPALYERINLRTEKMLEQGLKQEVEWLLDHNFSCDLKSMKAIGYRHMCQYLFGHINDQELIQTIARDTRHYAKRQMTWFKRDDTVEWFRHNKLELILGRISDWLKTG